MTALGNMISWQRLDYDFSFHKQEFMTDIITLVLSEGKSILKVIYLWKALCICVSVYVSAIGKWVTHLFNSLLL